MTEPQQEMYVAERVAADAESTSAKLRRVEQERDEALARLDNQASTLSMRTGELLAARRHTELARAELASARTELDAVRTVRDNLDRELAEACAETLRLAAARSWIVARDGGRYCERCEQEIRRGEAYELEPGTSGLMVHIHCRAGEPIDG